MSVSQNLEPALHDPTSMEEKPWVRLVEVPSWSDTDVHTLEETHEIDWRDTPLVVIRPEDGSYLDDEGMYRLAAANEREPRPMADDPSTYTDYVEIVQNGVGGGAALGGGRFEFPPSVSEFWHVDNAAITSVASFSILQGVTVTATSGHTDFFNAQQYYAGLTEEQQRELLDTEVEYIWGHAFLQDHESASARKLHETSDRVIRPAIVTDPVTGLDTIFFAASHLKLAWRDGDVTGEFASLADIPENTPQLRYSHSWQEGDVAMWANLGVWHKGTSSDRIRAMHKSQSLIDDEYCRANFESRY